MMTACDRFEEQGTVARYVAGTSPADEVATFEDHYLTCPRCQQSVQVGAVVRNAALPARRRPMRRALLLTAAATVAVVVGVRGFQQSNVRSLGIVQTPPIYLGAAMRGSAEESSSTFDAAMSAYGKGDYVTAASRLGKLEEGTPDVTVAFFRGASLLMLRDGKGANAEFSKVLERGPTIYQGEALYYRARAHLLMGHRKQAEEDLQAAIANDSGIRIAAQQLLADLSK